MVYFSEIDKVMNTQHDSGDRQTVLVTGASGGIGLELARCFAADGFDLVLAARSGVVLEKVAKDLSAEFGVSAQAVACDLGTPDGASALVDEVARRNLQVDVLVNNAGYGMAKAMETIDPQEQLGMVDLNVRALTELTRAFWPGMLARRRGGVLNVSSMAAFTPTPFMAAYCGSKAYVLSFTQALWEEARGTGVHVTCLCPGSTRSSFHQRAGTEGLPSGKAPQMAADHVARLGYEAFRANKRVAIPGIANKAVAGIMHFIPNGLLLKPMRKLFER